MSDNIRVDSTLPETNADNKEQSLERPKEETNEKVKDNNEVTAGDDNEVDRLLGQIIDPELKESTNNENSIDKNDLMVNGERNNEPNMTENDNLHETQPTHNTAITTTNNQINAVANNSLSLLAQYDSQDSSSSSSESTSDAESSDKDSSTKSSSIDSAVSDSSVSSIHSEKSLNAIKMKIDEFEGVEDDDDPEEKRSRTPIKAIGELGIEDLPPIEDLHITMPEKECNLLGKITSIVDQLGKPFFFRYFENVLLLFLFSSSRIFAKCRSTRSRHYFIFG